MVNTCEVSSLQVKGIKEKELWYRNHFPTDGRTGCHCETVYLPPPQLWAGKGGGGVMGVNFALNSFDLKSIGVK